MEKGWNTRDALKTREMTGSASVRRQAGAGGYNSRINDGTLTKVTSLQTGRPPRIGARKFLDLEVVSTQSALSELLPPCAIE
jgi:hypothetical protein